MPTQLQLEGPDLETLLSRVKAEHGPGARIVRAEKVRTGGIAGFFAKERFEICVELDLPSATAAPATAAPAPAPLLDMTAPAPTSLLELADRVSAAEVTTHTRGAGTPPMTVRRRTDGPADARPDDARPAHLPRAEARLGDDRPVGLRRSSDRPGPPDRVDAATSVSTESTSFAAVLAGLGVAAGPGDESLSSSSTTPSQGDNDTAELAAVPRQRASFEPSSFGASVAASTTAAAAPVVSDPGSQVSLRRPAEVAVRAEGSPRSHACGQLVELGLPEHLLPEPAAGPFYPTLVQSLRQLPKAPRATNRAGGVVVVVGPQSVALDVAREIARDLKLPVATNVVLVTAQRGRTDLPAKQVLRSVAAVTERRQAWRRRKNLTVVAVDAPLTAAGAATARAFVTALQPSATWGVVEATRKAHDVGRWARALGGVDALALTAVEETADPAAVLTLGIPVGRLGATKATPAAWAALLTDRMAA